MQPLQLAFGYPRRGLTGRFNTFRLGCRWAEKLPKGAEVELVDARSKKVLKRATVLGVFMGPLNEMAIAHSRWAHNWRDRAEDERSALLVASMCRRYPPGRCVETSIVSVIYLREINDPNPKQ